MQGSRGEGEDTKPFSSHSKNSQTITGRPVDLPASGERIEIPPLPRQSLPGKLIIAMATSSKEHLLRVTFSCILSTAGNPEKRLFKDLMKGYSRASRPVLNANSSVHVNFMVQLKQIVDLDEKNQILTTSIRMREEWTDVNLNWNVSEYDGIETAIIPAFHLWLPDVYIFNNADESSTGFVLVNESKILLRYDGHVQWFIPMIIKTACVVRVMYFPFDFQTCYLKFGSWIYDGYQLELTKAVDSSHIIDKQQYVENSEFALLKVGFEAVKVDYECCAENYNQLHLSISFRRKGLYYVYTVIAPSVSLCIMTMFSFLLPCDCGEKIAIGMTVFLALYFLQMLISDNIPESNSTPLIGVFLTMVMTLNSISLIMATFVMNLKNRGTRKKCPVVPDWLLRLCRNYIGKLTCTTYVHWEFVSQKIVKVNRYNQGYNSVDRNAYTDMKSVMKNPYYHELKNDNFSQELHDEETVDGCPKPCRNIKYEWYYISEVIDTFLFLCYLVISVVTMIVILGILPSMSGNNYVENE